MIRNITAFEKIVREWNSHALVSQLGPRPTCVTTRYREAEGSSSYRHFYMGLLREDGTPKLALADFREQTPEFGRCQWFHFEDPRLDDAVRWMRALGVSADW